MSVVVAGAMLAPAYGQVAINEVRIDQPSSDNDEYFELAGAGGTSLDGLTYLVIGDGTGGSGVIEAVVDLTGQSIPPSGFFLAAESTFTLGTPDLVTSLDFENSDNVTHLLVEGFTGSDGDDLDTDDDCVLDVTPWSSVVDMIALVEEDNVPSGTECHYGPPQVGPDGSYVPGHAYRCEDATGVWQIGIFDPAGGDDTPGAANYCPATGACCHWGTYVCDDGVEESACQGPDDEWTANTLCADLDPPCEPPPPEGACCIAHSCVDGMEAANCTERGGAYQGDGTDCASVTCPTPPAVIISEIMYNPLSDEGGSPDYINLVEWVEIYNAGDSPVDISGWRLMDEDPNGTWLSSGPIPASTTIAVGEAVVLIPGPDTDGGSSPGLSEAEFQSAWGTGYQVYPLDNWGDHLYSLSNSPSDTNEILTLVDSLGVAVDVANYSDSYPDPDGWPNIYPGGPSIYVKCFALDGLLNDDGNNWVGSEVGKDGAFVVTPTAIFDGEDVGSPGYVYDCVGLTGACCNWATYNCVDGVGAIDCQGPDDEWTTDTLCANLDPPCEPPPQKGACCYAGFCVDDVTQGDCETGGGQYQGDDTTCATVTCPEGPTVAINEIRIDQPSSDNDEYFELVGDVGAPLNGLTYLVIGEGTGASGVIEAVVPLTGLSMGGSGFFVAAEDTFTLGTADLVTDINFENSDNVTHMLVAGFTGEEGDDLDTDDDCILDVTPWAGMYDLIALVEEENPPSNTECHYGPPTVGPDGTYVPGHVFRCEDATGTWLIGEFDPAAGDDTPGTPNACAPGACCVGGVCSEGPAAQCNVLGGTYQGEGTTCEGDVDGDGVDGTCGDNCPTVFNPAQENSDGDAHGDACDNCPNDANPGQANSDADSHGDACDNCPDVDNEDQANADGDIYGDVCDPCPFDADHSDLNGNGIPDCAESEYVPTVSEWGLVILALLLLTSAKLYFGRSRAFVV